MKIQLTNNNMHLYCGFHTLIMANSWSTYIGNLTNDTELAQMNFGSCYWYKSKRVY